MADTATISIPVLGIGRVTGRGRLLALATVDLDIDGLLVMLNGDGVVRTAAGTLTAEAPRFCSADGTWRAAARHRPIV